MKKFIFSIIGVGILALGIGYFVPSLLNNDSTATNGNQTEEVVFDKAKEMGLIENLVKTYITSSVNYDWETVKVLASGEYKTKLEETIIPNAKKLGEEKYEFNPRSLHVTFSSLNPKQAIVDVSYIVTKDGASFQEDILLYLGKENSKWVIISVETKS